MFGFSLGKLAVLAAIIAAVWYGFRFLTQLEARRAQQKVRGAGRPAERGEHPAEGAESMIQCPACQVFMPAADTKRCGRSDCPY